MSAENGKACCNCRHCIRERNEETLYTKCRCEITGEYLGYMAVMAGRCKYWASIGQGRKGNDRAVRKD